MTPENFCYWLQGYFELSKNYTLTSDQYRIIQDHLNLVFNKQTPSYSTTYTPPSIYDNPKGKGVLSCSLDDTIGFKSNNYYIQEPISINENWT